MDAEPRAGTCHKHLDRIAVAACDDCGTGLCARCRVDIADTGGFCWECAARRGGLRAGPRPLRAQAPVDRPIPGASFVRGEGVRQFEARVGDRPPHHLISGLTDRLAEAGADPVDVVDEDELAADIDHLQRLASTEPGHRRWGRRR